MIAVLSDPHYWYGVVSVVVIAAAVCIAGILSSTDPFP